LLNAFNLLAGLIGIVGVFLSAWMYVESKRNEAVEQEKAVTAAHRLADALSMLNAVGQQATLAANLSDRDEVTKKELKHLLVGQLSTITAAQQSVARQQMMERTWKFGVVAKYAEPTGTPESTE
jgi:hypothetical protein